ncbi:MAG: glycosyltransferase family 39 protein [Planctomycetaceae bacterium]|nr:glycosyltransferase family 39 protein [Planctomycetaceae bacterium]
MVVSRAPEGMPRLPGWGLLCVAVWLTGSLVVFFRAEPATAPRSLIWSLVLDHVLPGSATVSTSDRVASGVEFLSQRLPLVGAALLLLAAVLGAGLLIGRLLLRRTPVTIAERFVFSAVIGFSFQSVLMLALGAAGQMRAVLVWAPGGLMLLLELALQIRQWRGLNHTRERSSANTRFQRETGSRRQARQDRWVMRICAILILINVGWLLLGAMSPSSDFDVREYHLQGPKEWFSAGRIHYLPHNVYTSFPFLTEMISLSMMVICDDWWTGALAGKLVLACFQVLTALAVYSLGRRLGGTSIGWLACLIWVTTPWTLRISLIAYAEGGLTFFQTCVILTGLLLLQSPDKDAMRRLQLILGIAAGAAMACKYTGLISAVFPAGVIAVISCFMSRQTFSGGEAAGEAVEAEAKTTRWSAFQRKTMGAAGTALFLVGLGMTPVIGPWLIRNAADTGNPVFPLADSIFHSPEWSAEMDARWKPAHGPAEHRLSLLPRHFLDVVVGNDWTNALFFALSLPAAVCVVRDRRYWLLLGFTCWTFLTWWALTHRIDRFWIPVIPVLSLLAAMAVSLSSAAWWRSLIYTTIAACTIYNMQLNTTAAVGYHAGLMDLTQAREQVIPPHLRTLNRTLPPDSLVLMVGEAQVFDATFPLYYHTVFDECILEEWLTLPDDKARPVRERRMRAPEEIQLLLQEYGVTHILVNWQEILRYRQTYGYTDFVQPARFQELVANGVLEEPQVLAVAVGERLTPGERQELGDWDGIEILLELRNNSPAATDHQPGASSTATDTAGPQPVPVSASVKLIQLYRVAGF